MSEKAVGSRAYELAQELYPICRSITGDGVRQTLEIVKRVVPALEIHEVPTGYKALDWTVPKEWNIRDAYIEDELGKRVISFGDNNLHVMGYSAPIDQHLTLDELLPMIYTQPDQPEFIPYVTSYYKERSGFCMSENQKNSLKDGEYHAVIDSQLADGFLTYADMIIPGETKKEVLFSTYICHPTLANNELSGPSLMAWFIKWIQQKPRRYTYRFIFVPETIGSLVYLSKHLDVLKENVIAGFVLSCVGDERAYSIVESRYGNTLADKVLAQTLEYFDADYRRYSFLERGSDERQYCAPGIDLPVCGYCRSKYGEYPEYHTSADDMLLVTPEGLESSFQVLKTLIGKLEDEARYKSTVLGEPQMGKYEGLYPSVSQKGELSSVRNLMHLIAYSDGTNSLADIGKMINVSEGELHLLVDTLLRHELVKRV